MFLLARGNLQVEDALRKTQTALQSALARHEADDAEKQEAYSRLERTLELQEELQRQLDESQSALAERLDVTATQESHLQIAMEDAGGLRQRLIDAEERAEQLTAESARAYAEAARQQAFLEGENTRLQELVEHLRGEGQQLQEELREANLQAQHCRSLEHRLKSMESDEQVLQERIEALEAVVTKKERDLLELLNSTREQEEERSEQFSSELGALSKQLKAAQERAQVLTSENKHLGEELARSNSAAQEAQEELQEKLLAAEKECQEQSDRVQDLEFELRNTCAALKEQELRHSQADAKVRLLQEEAAISSDTYDSTVAELREELQEKQEQVRGLDLQLSALKSKVVSLEADFVQRDEEIAGKLLRRAAADEDNRQLRQALDAQTAEVQLLRTRLEKLEVQLEDATARCDSTGAELAQVKEGLADTEAQLEEAEEGARYEQTLVVCPMHNPMVPMLFYDNELYEAYSAVSIQSLSPLMCVQ